MNAPAPKPSRGWPKFFRQGDILIERIESLSGVPPLQPAQPFIEVAQGEVTGHAHVLLGVAMEADAPTAPQWVRLAFASTLKHDEHAPIQLEPGLYRIRRQRRYDWPEEREAPETFDNAYD
jgi:hypothetical protein